MKTDRDPKPCEICGSLFAPRQERSRICDHAECRKISVKKALKNWRSNPRSQKTTSFTRRPTKEFKCLSCGGSFTGHSRQKFCTSEECKTHAMERARILQFNWRSENKKPRNPLSYNEAKTLEEATPSLMAKILEGWINTIFSEREQVELIFLESSHLRGSRDSSFAEDFHYRGGSVWGGIFPNRGGRA